jgi:acyl dehydratase
MSETNTYPDLRPPGARVTMAMLGSQAPPTPITWDERDTILYALGVGAGLGQPDRELQFTTENSLGFPLKALPSFLTVLVVNVRPPAMAELDIGRLLHAGQEVELFEPLPSQGAGFLRNRVEAIDDKGAGSGAIIRNAAMLFADAACTQPLARSSSSIFVRGAGGFGGPRSPSAPHVLPQRAPDFRVACETRPEQALLYRLSGDRNRLHSDPVFAREYGFAVPILHGLCTYGIACRALVDALAAGDAERLAAMSARFSQPVLPGQTLTTEIWHEADGGAMFRTINPAGETVLERGTARLHQDPNL